MTASILEPWPWYVGGILIGLTVPALLLIGNKPLGISSSLRDLCAICDFSGIKYFDFNWRSQLWNLAFVAGIPFGAFLASMFLTDSQPLKLSAATSVKLMEMGLTADGGLMPDIIFSWKKLFSSTGILFVVLGGLLVGFGTRWAGGCTSGHAIMGLSTLQWPSLIATCCFMIGGFASVWLLVPYFLSIIL